MVVRLFKVKEFSVFLALLAICVVVSLLSPYFLKVNNIFNVLRQISVIAILATGQALIIITGGIDLSVGNVLGLCGVVLAVLAGFGLPSIALFILTVLFGCGIGLINGFLVAKVKINPFIVTLGMMSIARGTALLITGGMPIQIKSKINFLGGGYFGPIPVSVIIMFLIIILGVIFTTRFLAGRNVYAVGSNERAAKLSGIQVDRVKMMVYIITGALCALSGILMAGTLNNASPASGAGYELDVIAAVVIGGASLSGGEGSVIGILLGASIMGVLRNAFVLLGVSAYWQVVTIGVVIIAAVAIDSIKNLNVD